MSKRKEEDSALDTCQVCLGPYLDPKFLPCFHTFCCRCIAHVASNHTTRFGGKQAAFPCPCCRHAVLLPPGGATALQTNFYVSLHAAKQATAKATMCQRHSEDKPLEFYCVLCDLALCLSCKLTEHETHTTLDLSHAADLKLDLLPAEQRRLHTAVDRTERQVQRLQSELTAVEAKTSAVTRLIHERHDALQELVTQARDDAVVGARYFCDWTTCRFTDTLTASVQRLDELYELDQQINEALSTKTPTDVINVNTVMTYGSGSRDALRNDLAAQQRDISTTVARRPVLRADKTRDEIKSKIKDFLGCASLVETSVATVEGGEMEGELRFTLPGPPKADVLCLCHDRQQPASSLWVSYNEDHVKSARYDENGDLLLILDYMLRRPRSVAAYPEEAPEARDMRELRLYEHYEQGRISFKAPVAGLWGEAIVEKSDATAIRSFSKSPRCDFHLHNDRSGTAQVFRVHTTPEGQADYKTHIEITVGPHRAFDADDTGCFFAVVEEEAPEEDSPREGTTRTVKLFRWPGGTPVCRYSPASTPSATPSSTPTRAGAAATRTCQPTDVCFFRMDGGQRVMLVTDELNDRIHVLRYASSVFSFVRFLAPRFPLLMQPTAMTTDAFDRLWVACRGGGILLYRHPTNGATSQPNHAFRVEEEEEEEEEELDDVFFFDCMTN